MINFIRFKRNSKSRFKLLDKDFTHVDCFIYDAVSWVQIEATHNRLHLKTYPSDILSADNLVEDVDCSHVLMQEVDEDYIRSKFKLRLFNLFSCVTIAKFVCGVESSLIITPKQLYRHLLKQKNVELLK